MEVLNGISLHGGLTMSAIGGGAHGGWTSKKAVKALLAHWREYGLPDYAQFESAT